MICGQQNGQAGDWTSPPGGARSKRLGCVVLSVDRLVAVVWSPNRSARDLLGMVSASGVGVAGGSPGPRPCRSRVGKPGRVGIAPGEGSAGTPNRNPQSRRRSSSPSQRRGRRGLVSSAPVTANKGTTRHATMELASAAGTGRSRSPETRPGRRPASSLRRLRQSSVPLRGRRTRRVLYLEGLTQPSFVSGRMAYRTPGRNVRRRPALAAGGSAPVRRLPALLEP